MSKSPEEYFQDRDLAPAAPSGAAFTEAELAFMRKYMGVDAQHTLESLGLAISADVAAGEKAARAAEAQKAAALAAEASNLAAQAATAVAAEPVPPVQPTPPKLEAPQPAPAQPAPPKAEPIAPPAAAQPAEPAHDSSDIESFRDTMNQQFLVGKSALAGLRENGSDISLADALYRSLKTIQNSASYMNLDEIKIYAERTAGVVDQGRKTNMDFGVMVDLLEQECGIIEDMVAKALLEIEGSFASASSVAPAAPASAPVAPAAPPPVAPAPAATPAPAPAAPALATEAPTLPKAEAALPPAGPSIALGGDAGLSDAAQALSDAASALTQAAEALGGVRGEAAQGVAAAGQGQPLSAPEKPAPVAQTVAAQTEPAKTEAAPVAPVAPKPEPPKVEAPKLESPAPKAAPVPVPACSPQEDLYGAMSEDEPLDIILRRENELQMVAFFLGKQEFIVPTMAVQEVIRYEVPAKMPAAPEFVAGVINFRGKMTPLVHLRDMLEIRQARETEDRFIIVCRRKGLQIGLIIERVRTMYRVPQSDIEWGIESLLGINNAEFLSGLLKLNDNLVGIVSVDRIIDYVLE